MIDRCLRNEIVAFGESQRLLRVPSLRSLIAVERIGSLDVSSRETESFRCVMMDCSLRDRCVLNRDRVSTDSHHTPSLGWNRGVRS